MRISLEKRGFEIAERPCRSTGIFLPIVKIISFDEIRGGMPPSTPVICEMEDS